MDKLDLRCTDWREAIINIGDAVEGTQLTTRALALLIADSSDVTLTQAREVLNAIPKLRKRYLKPEVE